MRTRSSLGGVYSAKFGSHSRHPLGAAPPGVSGAVVQRRLLRLNQKLVLVRARRARLVFLSRRGPRAAPSAPGNQGAVVMKRIRTVGLCLVAAFAVSVIGASSASAAELLARPAGGGSIAGSTFLSSAGLAQLFTTGGSEIDCKDATNHGLFLSATLGNILIRFLGCSTKVISNEPCNSTGAGTGEIHLPLSTLFHLGLAHLTSATAGVPAAVILLVNNIVIKCSSLATIEVRGAVIGALQRNGAAVPLNTAITDVNLNFQQTATGVQHLRLFLMPGTTGLTTYDLESNLNGGAFGLASEVANALLDGFKLPGGKEDAIEFVEP